MNSLVTGEFPSQRASNVEKASMWWLGNDYQVCMMVHTKFNSTLCLISCPSPLQHNHYIQKVSILQWLEWVDKLLTWASMIFMSTGVNIDYVGWIDRIFIIRVVIFITMVFFYCLNQYGPVTMIVPASGQQVRCIPWVQMGTFNKENGFLCGLKLF